MESRGAFPNAVYREPCTVHLVRMEELW
jgi:hypothetical protein